MHPLQTPPPPNVHKIARTSPLKVVITPELHERLRRVAAQLGQAPATIAAMAIGQYVTQMQSTFGATDRAIDKMMDAVGPGMAEQLKLAMNAPDPQPAPKVKPRARKKS